MLGWSLGLNGGWRLSQHSQIWQMPILKSPARQHSLVSREHALYTAPCCRVVESNILVKALFSLGVWIPAVIGQNAKARDCISNAN
jgi:hypothetical protein